MYFPGSRISNADIERSINNGNSYLYHNPAPTQHVWLLVKCILWLRGVEVRFPVASYQKRNKSKLSRLTFIIICTGCLSGKTLSRVPVYRCFKSGKLKDHTDSYVNID